MNAVMLNAVTLNAFMLNAVLLNVSAPLARRLIGSLSDLFAFIEREFELLWFSPSGENGLNSPAPHPSKLKKGADAIFNMKSNFRSKKVFAAPGSANAAGREPES